MALGSAAHRIYGQGLSSPSRLNAIPRNKYSFTVELTYNDGKTLVLERIANVMMPSFVYRTQTLNNYNSKRIIQTGIDYTPITLTAYDTKDAEFENFLKSYAAHYFAGPMNEDDYNGFLNNPKGLELRNNRAYITIMTITRHDAKNLKNVIEIFHPYITNADADTLDYSDSSPSVFRVSFAYEGYNIKSTNAPPTGLAPPGVLNPPTEPTAEVVEEHIDASGTYTTTDANVTSNKSTLRIHAQGIWANSVQERLAIAQGIVAQGNVVPNDTKFVIGKNILVTKDGIVYEAQADVNVVKGDLPAELDDII